MAVNSRRNEGPSALNVTPKAEKGAEIFTETHPLGVKIDAEHAGAIIFKPKSSKTYEFSQFLNKTTFFLTFIDYI